MWGNYIGPVMVSSLGTLSLSLSGRKTHKRGHVAKDQEVVVSTYFRYYAFPFCLFSFLNGFFNSSLSLSVKSHRL